MLNSTSPESLLEAEFYQATAWPALEGAAAAGTVSKATSIIQEARISLESPERPLSLRPLSDPHTRLKDCWLDLCKIRRAGLLTLRGVDVS